MSTDYKFDRKKNKTNLHQESNKTALQYQFFIFCKQNKMIIVSQSSNMVMVLLDNPIALSWSY